MSPLLFQNILNQIQTMNDVLDSYKPEVTAAAELCNSEQLRALEDALGRLCERSCMLSFDVVLRIPADVQSRTTLERDMLAREITVKMNEDVRPQLDKMATNPYACQEVTDTLRAVFMGRLPSRAAAVAAAAAGEEEEGEDSTVDAETPAEKMRRRRHCKVLAAAHPVVVLTFAVVYKAERWTAMDADLFYPLIERIAQTITIRRRPWYLLEMVSLFTVSRTGAKVSLRESNEAYNRFMEWLEGLPVAPRPAQPGFQVASR